MTDLMEKSLQTLEFPAVLELLAAQAVSDETRERVRNIRPSTDRGENCLSSVPRSFMHSLMTRRESSVS